MYRIIFLISLLALTTSCGKMKDKLGLTTTGPDEYKTQRTKTLEVPPHYDLPAPYKPAVKDNAEVATKKTKK